MSRLHRVVCPHDETSFQVPADLVGRSIRCPHCHCTFTAVRVEPTEPRTPGVDPLFWGDRLLFMGMGAVFLFGIVYWVLRWFLGIDLIWFP